MRRFAVAALALGLGHAASAEQRWDFEATLNGTPIGSHRFTVVDQGGTLDVRSIARFDVRLFGFNAYRYDHESSETWRDGCLVSMRSRTDDDGQAASVDAHLRGDGLAVSSPAGTQDLPGCVMSFAYWNPAMQTQSHLLNAQTGRYERVQISEIGDGMIEVRGKSVRARHVRVEGTAQPIDLWYSPQGDWLALDSTVAGGRKLSYRLR